MHIVGALSAIVNEDTNIRYSVNWIKYILGSRFLLILLFSVLATLLSLKLSLDRNKENFVVLRFPYFLII